MKLHIENFSKIKEADIEINGITMIAGENNTGKSTVGKLLYCFFETFHNYEDRLYKQKKSAIEERVYRYINFDKDLENAKDKEMLDNYRYNPSTIAKKIIEEFHISMTMEEYKKMISNILSDYVENIEISQLFFIHTYSILSVDNKREMDNLITLGLNAEFKDDFYPTNNNNDIHAELFIKDGNIKFDIVGEEKELILSKYRSLNTEVVYYDNPFVIDDLNYENNRRILSRRFMRSNRDGRILNHSQKMIKTLNKVLSSEETNVYNQILGKDLVHFLEDDITKAINGTFIQEDGQLKFREKDSDRSLNIENLSTGVKSFAILLKLIKAFKISENGTLILDEPEIHLHPKWQLKYAELLVLLQKRLNLHILINSHSPYFVNAIEVYTAKHNIADKCKYYLSNLDENNRACFEDVTTTIDKIYEKLSKPLFDLEDEIE